MSFKIKIKKIKIKIIVNEKNDFFETEVRNFFFFLRHPLLLRTGV